MPTIYVWLDDMVGVAGMYMFLRTAAGALVNAGGDALTDPDETGRFQATIGESLTGLGTLRARVSESSDETDAIFAGWLAEGSTIVIDEYQASASASAIADAVCDELLSGHTTAGSLGKTLSNLAQNVSAGRITVVSRIEGDTITLHIDDDYKVRSGTELEIPVTDAGSVLFTRLDALDLDDLSFGASREGQSAGEITGTVANLTHANGVTTFTIEITGCGSGLRPGTGLYQIQSSETHSGEHDDHIEVSGPLVLERRVVAPRG